MPMSGTKVRSRTAGTESPMRTNAPTILIRNTDVIPLVPDFPVDEPGDGGGRRENGAEGGREIRPHLEVLYSRCEIQQKRCERNGEERQGKMDEFRGVIDGFQDLHPVPRSLLRIQRIRVVPVLPFRRLRYTFVPSSSGCAPDTSERVRFFNPQGGGKIPWERHIRGRVRVGP